MNAELLLEGRKDRSLRELVGTSVGGLSEVTGETRLLENHSKLSCESFNVTGVVEQTVSAVV